MIAVCLDRSQYILKNKKINVLKGFAYLKSRLKVLPKKAGVYQMWDASATLLYVGKAKNLRARLKSYAHKEQLAHRIQLMIEQLVNLEIIEVRSEDDALVLEAHLIRKHKPRYNIMFRDNKTLPCLTLTPGDWPRLVRVRARDVSLRRDVFGPFPSSHEIMKTQKVIQRIFRLRSCSDRMFLSRQRPCLQYDLKRCSAPCVGYISTKAYHQDVQGVRQLLKGERKKIANKLTNDMQVLSRAQRYEEAAIIRDQRTALTSLQSQHELFLAHKGCIHFVNFTLLDDASCLYFLFFQGGQMVGGVSRVTRGALSSSWEDLSSILGQFYEKNPVPDILILPAQYEENIPSKDAFFKKMQLRTPKNERERHLSNLAHQNALHYFEQERETKHQEEELLRALQKFCDVSERLQRIEIYDNSHLFGQNAYSAMVVATAEGFDKNHYRLWKIHEKPKDDYQSMRYVMKQRFAKSPQDHRPDLIIIDGGKGHLSAVQQALSQLDLPKKPAVLAIAKGEKRGRVVERFYFESTELSLQKGTPLYFYLERLRDEAHRFALQAHLKSRQRRALSSGFRALPGIGPQRARLLRQRFGTMTVLKKSDLKKDLAGIPGFSEALVQKIYDFVKKYD